MAQAGYTPIQLYLSTTASAVPSAGNLANGELAINITDGKLFYKDNGGVVRVLAGTGGTGVVAGSNTQVQFNNNGVFGASSSLTFDGTTLTANALTVSNAVTLSGGTANGVPYLNASKVLTTGSALTFDGTNFATTGIVTAGNGVNILFGGTKYGSLDGAAGDLTIASYSSGNIIYNSVANQHVFKGNGSEQMRLTSTGLGIGTSSPNFKIDAIASTGASAFIGTSASSLGTLFGALKFGSTAGSSAFVEKGAQIRGYASSGVDTSYLTFHTSDGTLYERMRLSADGNLGLGVTPSAWSAVAMEIGYGGNALWGLATNDFRMSTNTVRISGGNQYKVNGAAAMYNQASGGHYWYTAPSGTAGNAISFTPAMTLDASGRLLVNNTTGTYRVSVVEDGGSNSNSGITGSGFVLGRTTSYSENFAARILGAGTGISGSSYVAQLIGNGLNAFEVYTTGAATPLVFGTNSTERARIDSSGNFLFQTTNSSDSSGIGGKYIYNATVPYFATVGSGTSNSNAGYTLYSTGAAAYRFYVGFGGTVYATSTTISAISDIRYKENVRDLDVGLDAVMALKPRLYDWKEGKGANVKNARGFIAQEFEQVFPDLIDEWKDPAPEGEEPYKSVRQDLIPVLVKAIQEQQAIIEQLKADVAALKAAS